MILVVFVIILIVILSYMVSNSDMYLMEQDNAKSTCAPPCLSTTPTSTTSITPTSTGVVITNSSDCLALHNAVRSRQGMPPLVNGTADEIACANRVAQANYAAGKPHTNMCGSAQNECPSFASLKQCIDAYEKEGPSPGLSHYNNIKNARKSVACGEYAIPGKNLTYYSHQYK